MAGVHGYRRTRRESFDTNALTSTRLEREFIQRATVFQHCSFHVLTRGQTPCHPAETRKDAENSSNGVGHGCDGGSFSPSGEGTRSAGKLPSKRRKDRVNSQLPTSNSQSHSAFGSRELVFG